jgi:hypothetical protein
VTWPTVALVGIGLLWFVACLVMWHFENLRKMREKEMLIRAPKEDHETRIQALEARVIAIDNRTAIRR